MAKKAMKRTKQRIRKIDRIATAKGKKVCGQRAATEIKTIRGGKESAERGPLVSAEIRYRKESLTVSVKHAQRRQPGKEGTGRQKGSIIKRRRLTEGKERTVTAGSIEGDSKRGRWGPPASTRPKKKRGVCESYI